MRYRDMRALERRALTLWFDEVDRGALYDVPPGDRMLRDAVRFMASRAPEERGDDDWIAVMLAIDFRPYSGDWRKFSPAAFAAAHLTSNVDWDHLRKARAVTRLRPFFEWLCAEGELSEADLAVVSLNLSSAADPHVDGDFVLFEDAMAPGACAGQA